MSRRFMVETSQPNFSFLGKKKTMKALFHKEELMKIKIIKTDDGVYDVYIDGIWEMSRKCPDNILAWLSENTLIEFEG